MTKEEWQTRNVLSVESVAAYVRVSHTEQKLHGLSLDAQKMKLTEYAEKHNMRIVEWYMDEGVSGRKLIRKRPELQRMIQDAEKGKFTRILFIKLDRFFRSIAEYHECMKRIAPVIWTATEEEYDLSTANGRMLVNMKLTIAELEADQTGERIRLVNEYKASTGQPLVGDHSLPFCYMVAKDETTGRKKVVKNPDYEEATKDVIDYLFKYQNKRQAVIYLQQKHHISIGYTALTKSLQNTLICGEYRGNPNYCEGFLSREEFDKLQGILKRNIKRNTEKRDYIFSGLIICPCCGRKLAGGTKTQVNRSGKVYKYKKYTCGNYSRNALCDFSKSVNEAVIEREMLAKVEKYLAEAKIAEAEIQDAESVKIPKYNIEEIHEQIDRLNYSWQTGKIRKVEQYEKDYAELMAKLTEAEAEQGKVIVKDFDRIETILKSDWKGIYEALDDEHKRAFWRSFVERIEVCWTTEKKEVTNIIFF